MGEGESTTGPFQQKQKKEKTWSHQYSIKYTLIFSPIFWWRTPFTFDPGLNGCSNFKSSLEKPSDKCNRAHIIQIQIFSLSGGGVALNGEVHYYF